MQHTGTLEHLLQRARSLQVEVQLDDGHLAVFTHYDYVDEMRALADKLGLDIPLTDFDDELDWLECYLDLNEEWQQSVADAYANRTWHRYTRADRRSRRKRKNRSGSTWPARKPLGKK